MNTSLYALPQLLVNHLGACSRLDSLAALPYIEVPLSILRQQKNDEPYHVVIEAHGLTLTLQCIEPNAMPEEQTWGLHGITLSVGNWSGGWPAGFEARQATAQDVIALFSPPFEEIMDMHPMLCFTVEGVASQTLSVMAVFDTDSRKLVTFSLIRVGSWRELK